MADALTPEITTDRATVYRSTWRDLAATLPTNMDGASLAIVDGPYNMRKADWDTFRDWEHFRDWYRPELEELTRVLDTSANVYLWGTDTSASALRPLMAELGWRRRTRVIWDKGSPASAIGWAAIGDYADSTEVADRYTRGEPPFQVLNAAATRNIWRYSTKALSIDKLKTGRLLPNRIPGRGPEAETLHPCQKPLAFYDRLIRSSSRPGDTVLEPYGGTLRAAVACHRLPPSEARRAIVCEPHGPYIEAVRPSLEWVPPTVDGLGLFG